MTNQLRLARRRTILLLVTLLTCLDAHWCNGQSTRQLRVLSYNIHHAEGVDGDLNLERIAEVIRTAQADLVSLQEVDRNVPRSQGVDQPQRLAELLGMHVAFGANIELQGGEYGNAVLSKFPILLSRNHHLPNVDQGEQRGVLVAEIELPDARRAMFLATHFDHRRADKERIESAKAINSLVDQLRFDGPILLAGDLNAEPTSDVLKTLQPIWESSTARELPTIPVRDPMRQIDYVLMRRQSPVTLRALDARVLEEQVASDHRPILATIVAEWAAR